jgi:hypothetical protein
MGENRHPHLFYLLRDSTQKVEPVKLTLRHDLNGEASYESLRGVLSFDLETLAEKGTTDSIQLQLVTPRNGTINFKYGFQQ